MSSSWPASEHGAVTLPSGTRVRARSFREQGRTEADFTVLLSFKRPSRSSDIAWVKCKDFWIPDRELLQQALGVALQRSQVERVEITCPGGIGRTGLALGCLAILDGLDPKLAFDFVRRSYHPRAIEMPWQRSFVERFAKV